MTMNERLDQWFAEDVKANKEQLGEFVFEVENIERKLKFTYAMGILRTINDKAIRSRSCSSGDKLPYTIIDRALK